MTAAAGGDAPRAAAVLYASDVSRLGAFYEAVAGLAVAESTADFVTLVSDRWELTLVAVPATVAATLQLSDPPTRRSRTPIKLVFAVESLAVARAAALAAGGALDGAEWAFGDALVCDGTDTEGNVVQFRAPGAAAVPPPA
jgi:predicted enzyme related to lactoylglutathione lyase